jgi:hypothetical protein
LSHVRASAPQTRGVRSARRDVGALVAWAESEDETVLTTPSQDQRRVLISNAVVVVPGETDLIVCDNEGMPRRQSPTTRGRLLVRLHVAFPKASDLSETVLQALRSVLPPPPSELTVEERALFADKVVPLSRLRWRGIGAFVGDGASGVTGNKGEGGGGGGGEDSSVDDEAAALALQKRRRNSAPGS